MLQTIYGIGPKLAQHPMLAAIASKNYTETELRRQLKKPEIFKLLPAAAQEDLKRNPLKKIPRSRLTKLNTELQTLLRGIKWNMAGSYRRGRAHSRDIDLIVSTGRSTSERAWTRIQSAFGKSKTYMLRKPFGIGPGKISTMVYDKTARRHYKIDIFFTKPSEYMFALLYATGSGNFNIRMRAQAKRSGYMLNQKGLFKRNGPVMTQIPIKNEKHLFKTLKIRWRGPTARNE